MVQSIYPLPLHSLISSSSVISPSYLQVPFTYMYLLIYFCDPLTSTRTVICVAICLKPCMQTSELTLLIHNWRQWLSLSLNRSIANNSAWMDKAPWATPWSMIGYWQAKIFAGILSCRMPMLAMAVLCPKDSFWHLFPFFLTYILQFLYCNVPKPWIGGTNVMFMPEHQGIIYSKPHEHPWVSALKCTHC